MTEDTGGATRVALEELLDRVVPHIQVFLQDDLIDLAEYRKVLSQARASNDAHDKSRVNSYEVKIQDQNLSDEIRIVIERELSEYIHDNKVRTAVVAMHRLPHMDFSVTAAIQRLLDLSIILGAEEAANGFVRSLEADSCPYRRLTLLGGVTVEEEIPLYDGIRLLALPDINESLSSTFPDLLPDSELRHRFREAVLIEEERTISPQFMRPDDDSKFLTKATSQEAPDFDPGAFCLILSLVTKRQAYVSMQWTNMPEDEFINLLSGGAFLYFSVQSPELSMPFSANEIAEARTVYDQFRSAPANIKRRLEIPLTRLAASTSPTRSRIDTTIDLGIALESLYLHSIREELTFRLKLRAAKHLEDTIEKRKAIAKTLGKFYEVRSSVVHTGSPPSEYSSLSDLIKLHATTQEICRRSIRKILEHGHEPDWTDIDYI